MHLEYACCLVFVLLSIDYVRTLQNASRPFRVVYAHQNATDAVVPIPQTEPGELIGCVLGLHSPGVVSATRLPQANLTVTIPFPANEAALDRTVGRTRRCAPLRPGRPWALYWSTLVCI
ncbi:hypothetical protein BV20DRAFT_972907 [Pilatotrama ljubarskyi]|nr:hypothetical protein BV20DRAFT_972907 [Pilatotrama ljubarskyi]